MLKAVDIVQHKPVVTKNLHSKSQSFRGQVQSDTFVKTECPRKPVAFTGILDKLFGKKGEPKILKKDPELKKIVDRVLTGDKDAFVEFMDRERSLGDKNLAAIDKYIVNTLKVDLAAKPDEKKAEILLIIEDVEDIAADEIKSYGTMKEYQAFSMPAAGILSALQRVHKTYNLNHKVLQNLLKGSKPEDKFVENGYVTAALEFLGTKEENYRTTVSKMYAAGIVKKHAQNLDQLSQLKDVGTEKSQPADVRIRALKALPEILNRVGKGDEIDSYSKAIIADLKQIISKTNNKDLKIACYETYDALGGFK